jgi:pheromone shutdown protein TraB
MEENIYKAPESGLEMPVDIGKKTFKDSKFKKTIVMNFVGGILLFVVFIFCILKMMFSDAESFFIGVAVFYGVMSFIAFGTAHAIKAEINTGFQMAMLVFNWLCIAFFILAGVLIIVVNSSMPAFRDGFWAFIIIFSLLFVLPQIVNILAFRALRK